jgi:hypothetical protein
MNQKTGFIAFVLTALALTAFAACSNPSTVPDANTIGSNGGTVTSSDTNASVQIPAGALSGDTKISVTPITETLTGPAGSSVLPGSAFEIGGGTPSAPVMLTIRYDASKLAALSGRLKTTAVLETALKIFKLEGTTWSPLVSTVDTSKKSVSAASPSFGKFALLDGTYGNALGNSFTLTGTIQNWPTGKTAKIFNNPSFGQINTDGSFTVQLPDASGSTAQLPGLSSSDPGSLGLGACPTVAVSAADARGTYFGNGVLPIYNGAGSPVGQIIFNNYGTRPTGSVVGLKFQTYFFVDRAVTVKGECVLDPSKSTGLTKLNFDLNLIGGWNTFSYIFTAFSTSTKTQEATLKTLPLTPDMNWYFGANNLNQLTIQPSR